MTENEKNQTMQFSISKDKRTANELLLSVYSSMQEKGYDAVNQIVGYLLCGDPTYITSYNNARFLISMLERDELLEELVRFYMTNNQKKRDED